MTCQSNVLFTALADIADSERFGVFTIGLHGFHSSNYTDQGKRNLTITNTDPCIAGRTYDTVALMLYLFLGSTLLGSLSTAILLWRKSVVETELAKSQASDKDSQERANRAVEELGSRSKAYEDQLQLQRNQVDQLRKERDIALDALAKNLGTGSVAELLRLRNVPQVSSDPKSS
jgi:hypothetical protein